MTKKKHNFNRTPSTFTKRHCRTEDTNRIILFLQRLIVRNFYNINNNFKIFSGISTAVERAELDALIYSKYKWESCDHGFYDASETLKYVVNTRMLLHFVNTLHPRKVHVASPKQICPLFMIRRQRPISSFDCSFYHAACREHSHWLSRRVPLNQATPNDNTQDVCWTEQGFHCYVVGNPSVRHEGKMAEGQGHRQKQDLNCWIQQKLGVGGLYKRGTEGRGFPLVIIQ